jgi:hypothetical protein
MHKLLKPGLHNWKISFHQKKKKFSAFSLFVHVFRNFSLCFLLDSQQSGLREKDEEKLKKKLWLEV